MIIFSLENGLLNIDVHCFPRYILRQTRFHTESVKNGYSTDSIFIPAHFTPSTACIDYTDKYKSFLNEV